MPFSRRGSYCSIILETAQLLQKREVLQKKMGGTRTKVWDYTKNRGENVCDYSMAGAAHQRVCEKSNLRKDVLLFQSEVFP